jgi:hypothetical protein
MYAIGNTGQDLSVVDSIGPVVQYRRTSELEAELPRV